MSSMVGMLGKAMAVEARLGRRGSNAVELVFRDGPAEPLATAGQGGGGPEEPLATGVQGAGDTKKGKLGTLLGFRNGGVGKHSLVAADGRALVVESVSGAPSNVCAVDGTVVGRLQRGDDESVASDADG